MPKAVKYIAVAGLVAAVLAVPFLGGLWLGKNRAEARFSPRRDTLIVYRDTTIVEPVIVEKWRVKRDTVRLAVVDTLHLTDSVLVEVPIEQKVYREDSLYTAWVSGFRSSLDSIRITQKTQYVTVTVREQVKVRHLGCGVTAGPSVIYADRLRAGVGITAGLTYKF